MFREFVKMREALTVLYLDRCTISRSIETTGSRGETTAAWHVVEKNVPCRISTDSVDVPTGELVQRLNSRFKVFCSPCVDVKAGDRVVVQRFDGGPEVLWEYDGEIVEAGAVNAYSTHKMFIIQLYGVTK